MDTEYLQNLRDKLRSRALRLRSSPYPVYHSFIKQFLAFLEDNPVFLDRISGFETRFAHIKQEVEQKIKSTTVITYDNEHEYAAACYFVLKRCALGDVDMAIHITSDCYSHEGNVNSLLKVFEAKFIEPFYEYLDEHIAEEHLILHILRRYKHKCEWFQRVKLYDIWDKDRKHGERKLTWHLYEYLHDQGIIFYIDPTSISGKADLVSSQIGQERLVADAKIFNPASGRGKDYIAKGFRQIYDYTQDYNEPFGYLIIFKTCKESLKFSLKEKAIQAPFVTHNDKTIFFVTIDIFSYEKSASKRGKLKSIEISESDLVKTLSEE